MSIAANRHTRVARLMRGLKNYKIFFINMPTFRMNTFNRLVAIRLLKISLLIQQF